MSNILLLPVDILVNVFKKLRLPDLRNAILTCKAFRNLIINDNTIWRSVCREKLIINDPLNNRQPIQCSMYNRCKISLNWCYGYYRSKVLIQHYVNFMPWLVFHNSEVLIVSFGSELHCFSTDKRGFPNCRDSLWKLDVPKILRHDVRTNDISRFVIQGVIIACGNRDGCVAIYKYHDIKRKPKLQYHIQDCYENGKLEVTAVELIKPMDRMIVATGSSISPALMLYYMTEDDDNGSQLKTRNNYHSNSMCVPVYENAGIRCLSVNQGMNKLAIGLNGNSKPLLLDVNNTQFLMTPDATKITKESVRDIRWHTENTVVYVTHTGMLEAIDIRSHKVVYSVSDPFQSTLYCVKSDNEHAIVVGSSQYSRCVLFDIRNRLHHTQMYFTQKKTSPVYSLDFDSTKLITAVDRGVAVLNFNIDNTFIDRKDYSQIFY